MLILITEYEWKLGDVLEDGSAVLDILPTVGGQIPVRISISAETRETLVEKLTEGNVVRAGSDDIWRLSDRSLAEIQDRNGG